VSFGRNVVNSYVYELIENNQSLRTNQITDLSILFDERLTFNEHINDKVTPLYKGMVRSHIDYCSSVWALGNKGDIEMLERVQKLATKILSQYTGI